MEKIGIRKIEDLQPTALPKWFLAILAAAALSTSITIPLLLAPFAFNEFFGIGLSPFLIIEGHWPNFAGSILWWLFKI